VGFGTRKIIACGEWKSVIEYDPCTKKKRFPFPQNGGTEKGLAQKKSTNGTQKKKWEIGTMLRTEEKRNETEASSRKISFRNKGKLKSTAKKHAVQQKRRATEKRGPHHSPKQRI